LLKRPERVAVAASVAVSGSGSVAVSELGSELVLVAVSYERC
jgi:hypothetical protein